MIETQPALTGQVPNERGMHADEAGKVPKVTLAVVTFHMWLCWRAHRECLSFLLLKSVTCVKHGRMTRIQLEEQHVQPTPSQVEKAESQSTAGSDTRAPDQGKNGTICVSLPPPRNRAAAAD